VKFKRYLHTNGVVLAASLALLLVFVAVGRAATLDDYDARLKRAVTALEDYQHDQNGHGQSSATANFSVVRNQLPAEETVDFRGQSIRVNNSWLDHDLREFEKSDKPADRTAIVARIKERLQAIQQHVEQLRTATMQPGDKDAEKGRLAEILRRPEYVPAAPQGNALERLLDRLLRWLLRLFPKSKPMQAGNSRAIANVAQVLVIGVSLALIVLLIWKFGPRLLSGRRKKKKKREARIVLGEMLDPDQTAADLLAQAEGLAREGNLRAAIRKAYIALLCELADRKIISLAQYKTNSDYLNAVRDKGSLYTSMRKLTNSFEMHWYGFVPAGEADWDEFRNGYRKIFTSDG
jgi:Domain of unknown function (DUF4129)